jgi:hypothetical protein
MRSRMRGFGKLWEQTMFLLKEQISKRRQR